MDLGITLYWYAVAIVLYGLLTTIYKSNPFYDAVEGIGIGAAVGLTFWDNYNTIRTQLYIPLADNFATQWWLIFAALLGISYFFLYIRSLSEIFRFVSVFSLSLSLGQAVRTTTASMWQMVWTAANTQDLGYIVVWVFFILSMIYFIYAKKLEGPLAIPREIGRWLLVFELGALITPLYFRGVEAILGWTYKVNTSPAWWIPYAIFAVIAVDALNSKYHFITRRQEETART